MLFVPCVYMHDDQFLIVTIETYNWQRVAVKGS